MDLFLLLLGSKIVCRVARGWLKNLDNFEGIKNLLKDMSCSVHLFEGVDIFSFFIRGKSKFFSISKGEAKESYLVNPIRPPSTEELRMTNPLGTDHFQIAKKWLDFNKH